MCLFPLADGALFVQKKLGFRVDVRVSVSCRSGVLATSFKDAIDLLKTVYFLQPVVQPAGRIVLNIHKINKRMNE